MRFGRQLARIEERDGTNLADALRRLAGIRMRRGLLVVISDFFDPAGIGSVVDALKLSPHRLLLVQLARETDADPGLLEELQGEVRLRDCETDEAVDVAFGPAVVARYREIYRAFNDSLAEFARQREAGLLRLDPDGDVLEQLAGLFAPGRLAV